MTKLKDGDFLRVDVMYNYPSAKTLKQENLLVAYFKNSADPRGHTNPVSYPDLLDAIERNSDDRELIKAKDAIDEAHKNNPDLSLDHYLMP